MKRCPKCAFAIGYRLKKKTTKQQQKKDCFLKQHGVFAQCGRSLAGHHTASAASPTTADEALYEDQQGQLARSRFYRALAVGVSPWAAQPCSSYWFLTDVKHAGESAFLHLPTRTICGFGLMSKNCHLLLPGLQGFSEGHPIPYSQLGLDAAFSGG